MAGITLEMAEARLALYLAAEAKILKGQRVDMDGKSLTRADLAAVQQGIALWNSRTHNLAGNNRIQVREVIPR